MESPTPSFIALLRCPVTRLPLSLVPREAFAALGLAAEKTAAWSAALIRSDRKVLYPVRSGIPVLLAEELYPLPEAAPA
jgi:uncharacterized protein YbaR (Trm112 family)